MQIFKHFFGTRGSDRIYLDYASATPHDHQMISGIPALVPFAASANPSALHREGLAAKAVLTTARDMVARVLDVHADEIIWTASATESDNLAISGTVRGLLRNGLNPNEIMVMTSAIEHAAVTEAARYCSTLHVQHQEIEALEGVVDPKMIDVANGIKALIVSVMYVNNEIGTVQPIKDIAKRIRDLRKMHPSVTILFHTDATQAPLYMALRVPALGVDMMTLGATKLYCMRGVGMLYAKRGIALAPLMQGGGQERGLRPSTEPVALVHQFAHALVYAQTNRDKAVAHTTELQNYFETLVKKVAPEVIITAQDKLRTPHISHLAVPHIESELLVIELDARGIAVSAKSACKNEDDTESPIVAALYGKGYGAVRFSFGRMTTKQELDRAMLALRSVLDKYKK